MTEQIPKVDQIDDEFLPKENFSIAMNLLIKSLSLLPHLHDPLSFHCHSYSVARILFLIETKIPSHPIISFILETYSIEKSINHDECLSKIRCIIFCNKRKNNKSRHETNVREKKSQHI